MYVKVDYQIVNVLTCTHIQIVGSADYQNVKDGIERLPFATQLLKPTSSSIAEDLPIGLFAETDLNGTALFPGIPGIDAGRLALHNMFG
jgi:hypothetical protein